MNVGLVTFNRLGIKQLLGGKLAAGLNFYQNELELSIPETIVIPLHRAKDDKKVFYICAIAHKLAQLWQLNVQDIAVGLVSHLLHLIPTYHSGQEGGIPELVFDVQVVASGWILIQLTERYLADWLQEIVQGSWEIVDPQGLTEAIAVPTGLFPIQYAHARCSSLLRLADQENLISLYSPEPIPWLNPQGQLRLVKPAERSLMINLIDVIDRMNCPSLNLNQTDLVKLATALSLSFDKFYRYCRIWGTKDIDTARARLGLIMATQKMLRIILQNFLGVWAPTEL